MNTRRSGRILALVVALAGLAGGGVAAAHPQGGGGSHAGGSHSGGAVHGSGGFRGGGGMHHGVAFHGGGGGYTGAGPGRWGGFHSAAVYRSGGVGVPGRAYYGGGGGGGYRGGGAHYAGAGAHYGGGWYGHGGGGGYGHGWRGGYRGGLRYGLFFAALPLYYSTFWWGGIPYYYADSTYYLWNGDVGQYESVPPPAAVAGDAPAPSPGGELYVYPKAGQTDEQQSQDRYECYRWAADQTGFDPANPSGGRGNHEDYLRADATCLEARGYSVR